jgi:hypothetical protein
MLTKLETELLFANGQWDYAMQDETHGIGGVRIEITWNRKTRESKENMVPLTD